MGSFTSYSPCIFASIKPQTLYSLNPKIVVSFMDLDVKSCSVNEGSVRSSSQNNDVLTTGQNVPVKQRRRESDTRRGRDGSSWDWRDVGSRQSGVRGGGMRSQLCTRCPGDGQGRRHDVPSVCLPGSPREHAGSVRDRRDEILVKCTQNDPSGCGPGHCLRRPWVSVDPVSPVSMLVAATECLEFSVKTVLMVLFTFQK